MILLKAIEISDVLNQDFQSESNIVIRDFIDPYLRYEQHLEAIAGYEGASDNEIADRAGKIKNLSNDQYDKILKICLDKYCK